MLAYGAGRVRPQFLQLLADSEGAQNGRNDSAVLSVANPGIARYSMPN